MKKSKTSIVCGLHRSGTTYVGRVLSLADSTAVIHEPFNPVWGLIYAPPAYTYGRSDSFDPMMEETVRRTLLFSGNFAKPTNGKQGLQRIRFGILGGKQHFQWTALKLRRYLQMPPEHIVWKDPFCTFMVDSLSRFRNMKIVLMMRHPCAHYHSVSKQNWHFNIDHLTVQKGLLRDYGQEISEDIWKKAKSDNLVSIALLWKLMCRMVVSLVGSDPNQLVIRHEDLCMEPEIEFERICRHLGIRFTSRMREYILGTSQGSATEAPTGEVHGFERDRKPWSMSGKANFPLKR